MKIPRALTASTWQNKFHLNRSFKTFKSKNCFGSKSLYVCQVVVFFFLSLSLIFMFLLHCKLELFLTGKVKLVHKKKTIMLNYSHCGPKKKHGQKKLKLYCDFMFICCCYFIRNMNLISTWVIKAHQSVEVDDANRNEKNHFQHCTLVPLLQLQLFYNNISFFAT